MHLISYGGKNTHNLIKPTPSSFSAHHSIPLLVLKIHEMQDRARQHWYPKMLQLWCVLLRTLKFSRQKKIQNP